MARVTVEDCIDKISNRFELVLLASHRSRGMSAGEELTIDRDRDKNPVVALREIAEETILADNLREDFIASLQRHIEVDEPEEQPSAVEGDMPELPEVSAITEEDLLRALASSKEAAQNERQ